MNAPIKFSEFENIRVVDGGFEVSVHFGARVFTVTALSARGLRDWRLEDGVWRQDFSAPSREAALLTALRIIQDRLAVLETESPSGGASK